jgi:hypothetical protein
LDFFNSLVFEIFYLFEGILDDSQGFRVYFSCSKKLVNLSVFCLQALLDGFKLALEDKVSKACLLLELINSLVKRFEQLFFFSL